MALANGREEMSNTVLVYEFDETAKGAVTLRIRVEHPFDADQPLDANVKESIRIYDLVYPELEKRRNSRMGG